MKTKFAPPPAIIITAIAIVIMVVSQMNAKVYRVPQPTFAPPPTPGEPLAGFGTPSPTLAQPLVTEALALEQALFYDSYFSVWQKHSWSATTLKLEPGRITLKAFPSRTAESAEAGRDEWFAPEVEADAGAVWRITIKGDVHVSVISMRPADKNAIYDGVTYVISQRTGNLLAVIPGTPK